MSEAVIAIVGAGSMGRAHAESWSSLGMAERIRYVCTSRPGASLEHAPHAQFITDFERVLADPEVTIVSICTPTPSHPEYAVRALAAGKNVLLEKPIALTLAQADEIARAAEHSSGILMVAHVVRFFRGYQQLHERAEDGEFGAVSRVHATRLAADRERPSWFDDEAISGGVLVDFAIHDFDQLNLYLGTPIVVSAVHGELPGSIETTVEYLDGGIGRVTTNNRMPADSGFSSSIALDGDRGAARYLYSDSTTDASEHEGPYVAQTAYFLECIRAGSAPALCPTPAALAALTVSLAARESLATGHAVRL